jgi:CheY-like chemotaxis protein
MSNAIKFTPQGGKIHLDVSHVGQDSESDVSYIRFSVADTGIGIPDDQMERLFTSFEQADNSIARRYGGTGLGLAISKRIIELMRGTMHVESAVGTGSTFSFIMPVRRGSGEGRHTLPKGIGWHNIRVLAVDDAEETQEYFRNTADVLGFHCDIAEDGLTALDLIEAADTPYDIAFVDWKMPIMNGIELAERIKAKYRGNAVVIMISAAEWTDIEARARDAGVDGFIPKPLFTSVLTDTINGCLSLEQLMEDTGKTGERIVHSFHGVRILLAEDIEINREIVGGLFEGTGAQIVAAENGAQALQRFQETPDAFDAIFMDIHMPEMDGYEATRRIRALEFPKARTIPIIAMTANVFKDDIDRCMAVGMNDHVGKPLDVDEVMAKLEKQLVLARLR